MKVIKFPANEKKELPMKYENEIVMKYYLFGWILVWKTVHHNEGKDDG